MNKIDITKYIKKDSLCKEEIDVLLKLKWYNEFECYLTYLFLIIEKQIENFKNKRAS